MGCTMLGCLSPEKAQELKDENGRLRARVENLEAENGRLTKLLPPAPPSDQERQLQMRLDDDNEVFCRKCRKYASGCSMHGCPLGGS